MKCLKKFSFVGIALLALALAGGQAAAQQKPNIMFIMGDDIGWMQPTSITAV
jgi:arylsulfatase